MVVIADVQLKVGEVGALTLGEKPLSILPLELLSVVNVLCCVPFHPLCGLTNYTLVGTSLGLAITVDMLEIGPVDCHT